MNYSIVFVAAAFAVMLAIQYFAAGQHVQQIPCSQFKELLAEGKVKVVVVPSRPGFWNKR